MKLNDKNKKIKLNHVAKVWIEFLVERSDSNRECQSLIADLLPIVFETPDLSRGQDHFPNLNFSKVKRGGLLFMYPDLN